jgi:hypothetical protein
MKDCPRNHFNIGAQNIEKILLFIGVMLEFVAMMPVVPTPFDAERIISSANAEKHAETQLEIIN